MTTAMTMTANAVPLVRWFISSATLPVPQAAGPVTFALVALALTGDTSGGAGMILAIRGETVIVERAPRVSGDDPRDLGSHQQFSLCSPRERG